MQLIFRNIFIFFLTIVGPYVSHSQSNNFVAKSSSTKVAQGETFEVSFELKNVNSDQISAPSFKNFEVVGGPSRRSNMSIINGSTSRSTSLSYILLATKVGKYRIGAATAVVNGKTIRTNELEIQVSKSSKKSNIAGKPSGQDLYVQMEISDSTAHLGQQVTVSYVLYSRVDVASADFLTEPDYTAFYTQRLNKSRRGVEEVMVNGKKYARQTLRRVALFPQKTGSFDLKSSTIVLGLPLPGQRNNSFFFSRRTKKHHVKTNDAKIHIIPLPKGAPASYSGAIGSYSMVAKIDKNKITTDDAFTITMTIRGDGDGRFLEAPIQPKTEGCEYYDPNLIAEDSRDNTEKVIATKSYEYLVVPTRPGVLRIQPEFSYYDTDSNSYETIYGGPFAIQVVKGQNYDDKDEIVKENILTMRGIDTDLSISSSKESFLFSTPYFLVLLVCFGGLGIIGYKKKERDKTDAIDPKLKKQEAAQKMAIQRLEAAENALNDDNSRQFYEEINTALYGYVSDKLLINPSDLTKELISTKLQEKQLSMEKITELNSLLSKSEMGLYAGSSSISKKDILQSTVDLIVGIEDELGG